MNLHFRIDKEACVQCGSCVQDCPYNIIEMVEDGFPETNPEKEAQCIKCQHCLAICPTGALSILGFDPADSLPLKGNVPGFDEMNLLVRGRRSIRKFKAQPLEKQQIDNLLAATGYAPTGVNNRQCVFHVVEDPEVMEAISKQTIESIRKKDLQKQIPDQLAFFSGIVRAWDNDNDVLFRKAPHMIIISAPESSPTPEPDGIIALSYFELLAATMKVGTLWDGLAKIAFTAIVPEMKERLNIPKDHKIIYVMLFGKPAIKYHRTVQREDTIVRRIT